MKWTKYKIPLFVRVTESMNKKIDKALIKNKMKKTEFINKVLEEYFENKI